MNYNFGPSSTNPRNRRAFAHAKVKQYKDGQATYGEAFEAVQRVVATRKGKTSRLGPALGGVVVEAYARDFEADTVVIAGLSPANYTEMTARQLTAGVISRRFDVYMVRPDAERAPALGSIIQDPIAEGFTLLDEESFGVCWDSSKV